jgi:hypothetical protein
MDTTARPIIVDPGAVRTRQDEELLRDVRRILESELMLGSCCLVPSADHRQESAPVLFTEGYDGQVDVSVADGQVTLTGEVASEGERALAGRLAWSAPGCRQVVNDLSVAGRP